MISSDPNFEEESDIALANYNHYQNLRDVLLAEQNEKEKKLEEKAKILRKEKNLYWRKEGDQIIKEIVNTKENLQKILLPRNNLNIIIKELKKVISFSKKAVRRFSIYLSSHVLYCIHLIKESKQQAYIFSITHFIPKFYARPFSTMIHKKMAMIHELSRIFKHPSRYWLLVCDISYFNLSHEQEHVSNDSESLIKALNDDDFPPLRIAYSPNCITNISIYEDLYAQSTFNFPHKDPSRPLNNFPAYSRRLIDLCKKGIFVEPHLKDQLYEHRHDAKIEIDKLKVIEDTQLRCQEVRNCKSNTHYNQNGCEKCGVRFMGSHLEGFVPYVTSVSRETGVATLCTLDFEEDLLRKEHVVQKKITDKFVAIRDNYDQKIFKHIWIRYESWWSFLTFRRKYTKFNDNHSKSLFYVRVRKLSQLKKDVDFCFKTSIAIDMKTLLFRYSEYRAELLEYVLKKYKVRNFKVGNVAQLFKSKIKTALEAYHEKIYQEWLRLQQIKPPLIEPPIILNELPKMEKIKLICYRENCNLRKFLSDDRYHQHMRIHFQEDKKRHDFYDRCKELKIIHNQKEKEFLSEIEDKRAKHLPAIEPASPSKLTTSLINVPSLIPSSKYFYLQLISTSNGTSAPYKIPIFKPRITIGTDSKCDVKISLNNSFLNLSQSLPNLQKLASKSIIPTKKLDPMISKVHCIVFFQDNSLSVIDNHSSWGTYVVSNTTTAKKVSHSFSRSEPLQFGCLLCLGVEVNDPIKPPISTILSKNIHRNPHLPSSISAIEAGSACVMYRILYQA